MTITKRFKIARRTSTPLVVARTSDAASVMSTLTAEYTDAPIMQWDAAQGFTARTEAGVVAMTDLCRANNGDTVVLNPADAIHQLRNVAPSTIVFILNAHRVWQDISTMQAIWNLRDVYKSNSRMLVMLVTHEATVPRELDSDVIVIDDPLPDEDQLVEIINAQYDNATLDHPDADILRRAVDATKGMEGAFIVEQNTAMCLTKQGVNLDELWESKRQAVERTPGATVHRDRIPINQVGGHAGAKHAVLREINSKQRIKLVVVFDEFEKSMAGAAGDTSGVSQDASKMVLTHMQDHGVRGMILFGHPGAGKTLIAKTMATEADCICIMADMGAMKGSLVGESEAKIRQFFKMVSSIAGDGGAFFVATCNSTGALTTEMRRRFKTGFFFVDLPDREEKDAVWKIHMSKRNLDEQPMPDDTNWTGAEIESACEKADNYSITLVEAAESIVPVAQAQPELIQARRLEASGRLLSSSTGRTYIYDEAVTPAAVPVASKGSRKVSVN